MGLETVKDMATDGAGNVYILSNLGCTNGDVDIAGNNIQGRSEDIIISSFTCNGVYRWSKVIGSTQDDRAISLRCDTLGGIYVAGRTGGVNSGNSTSFDANVSFG